MSKVYYTVINDNTGLCARYEGRTMLTHDEAVFIVAYRLGCARIPHHIVATVQV